MMQFEAAASGAVCTCTGATLERSMYFVVVIWNARYAWHCSGLVVMNLVSLSECRAGAWQQLRGLRP